MDSRQRILAALACRQPDRVPWMVSFIDPELQAAIVGRPLDDCQMDLDLEPGLIVGDGAAPRLRINPLIHPETARALDLDAIGVKFPIPLFCEAKRERGGHFIERGALTGRADLERMRFPDPDDEAPLRAAEKFVQEHRDRFAIFANIRLGAAPTLMSMGVDVFSLAVYQDRGLVEEILDRYTDWTAALARNLRGIGFDFMWAFDDIAFKSGPLFSREIWNEVFVPRLQKVTREIACPWIYHSDGNLLPILDDMLPLGMSAIHPLEPGSMDLDRLKAEYGRKLCLVGNMDIESTLSKAGDDEVEQTVRERIAQLGPGGGYILSDSNSVPYYCRAENVLAVSRAVRKYGNIYQ